jgi:hypothetical protein
VIKKWREQLRSFGWSVGSGLVGAGIGLMVAMLYIQARGW